MQQMIPFDTIGQHLVSATDFRRRAGAYLDKLEKGQSFVILRGNTPVGTLNPIQSKPIKDTRQADIEKIRTLAGGFHFEKSLSPDKLNEEYDKMYDEMLPR